MKSPILKRSCIRDRKGNTEIEEYRNYVIICFYESVFGMKGWDLPGRIEGFMKSSLLVICDA